MEYFKITRETEKWFYPILTEEMKLSLRMEPTVFAVGAVKDKKACGVLVFDLIEDASEIIYIAVSNAQRRMGVGTGMLNYLCEHALSSGARIGCSFSAKDKSDPLYLFFESQQAFTTTQDEGYVCEISMQQLIKAPMINENKSAEVTQFFSLPKATQSGFFRDMRAKGYFLSPATEDYIKPLCICYQKGNSIDAAVFFEKSGEKNLLLSFAYCSKNGSLELAALFSEAARRITDKLPADSRVYIAAVTPQSVAIVEKLLPEYSVTERFFRADWDMGE